MELETYLRRKIFGKRKSKDLRDRYPYCQFVFEYKDGQSAMIDSDFDMKEKKGRQTLLQNLTGNDKPEETLADFKDDIIKKVDLAALQTLNSNIKQVWAQAL